VRARLLLAAGSLLVLLGAPAASADPYPPSGVHVVTGTVSALTVTSGGTVLFSGSGFAPSSLLRLSVDGVSRGTTSSSTAGGFSVRMALDGRGAQVLAASGLEPGGRLRVVSATVTVVSRTVSARPVTAGLPSTGTDRLIPALGLGLGSVVVGSGLVLVGRARRRRPAAV
jgi:hypothetical protein